MNVSDFAESARYQVFVSSTYLDLQAERKAVINTLLSLDAFPAGMELFPATDGDAWDLIKRVIQDSDYYVLVIGGKYGSIDETDNLSYTEKEYDYAISIKKPIMAFVHGAPNELIATQIERTEEKQKLLDAFITKVQMAHHVNMWTSAEDLAGKVALSFNKFVRSNPAIGWVRADRVSSSVTISELAKAQIRISELETSLSETRENLQSEIDDLEGGSDLLQFDLWITASVPNKDGSVGDQISKWERIETTWQDAFRAFGPDLLVERDEEEIDKFLDGWLYFTFSDILFPSLRATAKAAGQSPDSAELPIDYEIDISTNRQGTNQLSRLLLQFKVLGLIERRDVNRYGDPGSYWILTTLGERSAVKSRKST